MGGIYGHAVLQFKFYKRLFVRWIVSLWPWTSFCCCFFLFYWRWFPFYICFTPIYCYDLVFTSTTGIIIEYLHKVFIHFIWHEALVYFDWLFYVFDEILEICTDLICRSALNKIAVNKVCKHLCKSISLKYWQLFKWTLLNIHTFQLLDWQFLFLSAASNKTQRKNSLHAHSLHDAIAKNK